MIPAAVAVDSAGQAAGCERAEAVEVAAVAAGKENDMASDQQIREEQAHDAEIEAGVRAAFADGYSGESARQASGLAAPHAAPPAPDQESWREPLRVTVVPAEAPEGVNEAPEVS